MGVQGHPGVLCGGVLGCPPCQGPSPSAGTPMWGCPPPFPLPAGGPGSHLDVAPDPGQQRGQGLVLLIPQLPLGLTPAWGGGGSAPTPGTLTPLWDTLTSPSCTLTPPLPHPDHPFGTP